jgi:RNA polymerase sigma factor (sigma-70 family)
MHTHVENPVPVLEPNAPTRDSLISRVRNWSDDESWQEFFELYWKLIYSLAVRAGLNECEAEEVVQATMISISKGIKDFEHNRTPGSFRNWICKQAWWKINDQLRVRQRGRNRIHVSEAPAADATDNRTGTIGRVPDRRDPFQVFLDEDWQQAVQRLALARVRSTVKPKHFQMFDLYVVKKWPIREVARLLQVSTAQVYLAKSRISRQLKKSVRSVEAELERRPPPPGTEGNKL